MQAPRLTIGLFGFLYYLGSVITLRMPGADVGIVLALLSLVLDVGSLRLGRALSIGLVWLAWLWICTMVSPDPVASSEQSWEMTKVWIVAFVGFNVLRTPQTVRLTLALVVFFFLIYPVRGAILNYLGGYTLHGRAIWNLAYANPNDLASFALLFGSCSLALALLSRIRLVRVASIVAATIMLVLILLTQSRGTFLAATTVISIGLLPRLKNIKVVATTALMLAVAIFFAPSSVWERVGGLGSASLSTGMAGVDPEGSAQQRFQIAQVALHVARENPLLGVGPGLYATAHAYYAAQLTAEFPLAGGNRDPHNTYLSTAAQSGFIGLIIFLALVSQALRALKARYRKATAPAGRAAYVLALGVLGVLLAGFFSSNQYINILHLQFVIIESLMVATAGASIETGGVRRPLRQRLRNAARNRAPARPSMVPRPA